MSDFSYSSTRVIGARSRTKSPPPNSPTAMDREYTSMTMGASTDGTAITLFQSIFREQLFTALASALEPSAATHMASLLMRFIPELLHDNIAVEVFMLVLISHLKIDTTAANILNTVLKQIIPAAVTARTRCVSGMFRHNL